MEMRYTVSADRYLDSSCYNLPPRNILNGL